ncbi:uncharacterized protein KGF55_002894 [Candida pseudojiufengensis]|uniref:uncharacterized protein n=1 Tax=Candida pseudojiufengensis TaxID=497109 RepID=UPI002224E379|nr:uncharacterized protein KGF55_002894 [Candida pseudojiufengensis]KAI5963102.1 hypothetical protein KGF55_002894 [Candida pseudojiufengensis]
MSSTPSSSPGKRSVLSPKPTNFTSPSKRKYFQPSFNQNSPKKSISKPSTPSKQRKTPTTLGFTIWEDKTNDKTNSSANHDIVGTTTSNKLNHNDQENILQPKKLINIRPCLTRKPPCLTRKPLNDLNIADFKGFITRDNETTQLTELYQPPNFNNDFKSLHKFNNLPCFVTPTKKDKYLTKSSLDDGHIGVINFDKYYVNKHRRSLSLGQNDAKLELIKKNGFTIMSN